MLKVNWDEAKCIHSGNCVKGFPQVFKIENDQFVINEAGGTEDDLRAAVAACPIVLYRHPIFLDLLKLRTTPWIFKTMLNKCL